MVTHGVGDIWHSIDVKMILITIIN
jgi:hypothetical protein